MRGAKKKLFGLLFVLVCAGCNPLGSSSIDNSFLSTGSGSDNTTIASGSCTAGTATASSVLNGFTFPDGSGGLTTGTMADLGAFDLTGTFSAGYVSSLTGLTASSVCSTTSILGSAGVATCVTGSPSGTTITANKVCSNYSGYNLAGSVINGSRSNCYDIAAPKTISSASKLVAWYAADSLYATNAATLSVWPDLSGNGRHAYQTTSGNRPTYITSAVNSLPIIRFAKASSQYMQTVDTVSTLRDADSSLTWILVVKPENSQNQYTNIIDYGHSGTNPTIEMNSNNLNQFCFAGSACATLSSASYQIVTGVYTGTGEEIWVNSISQSTGTFVLTWSEPQRIGIGTWLLGGGREYNGDIAEIILYKTALSTSDRGSIECYLSNKYGIGVSGC